MTGLLVDDAALLEHLGLATNLILERVVKVLERVEVLHLAARAELLRATTTQRDVAVAAHGARLHGAIGDADGEEDLAQLLHEEARLLRAAQVGLGHKLDERRAATVVVDERVVRAADTALGSADVHHLGGVLLHVDARDADMRGVGAILGTLDLAVVKALLGTVGTDLDIEPATHAEGDGALRGLEVLGHVRIEIVLTVEHRVLHDLAVGGQTSQNDGLNGRAVGHGQSTGHAQAHRAHVGVGLVVVRKAAAAEHLGVERGELGVDLEADDRLPVLENVSDVPH